MANCKNTCDTLWASERVELKKLGVFWRAVQDLIRDRLWQALNVSQRNLNLIQELRASQLRLTLVTRLLSPYT